MYGSIPLSNLLLRRQLTLYGKIARLPDAAIIHELVFEESTCNVLSILNRKRCRPRQEWGIEIAKLVKKMIPDDRSCAREIADEDIWKRQIWNFTELFKFDND